VDGMSPYSLAALAEAIIEPHGGGKYEIREFPQGRKRFIISEMF
jgi:hypothetical protein